MKRSLTLLVLLSLVGFIGAHAENVPRGKRLGVYVNTSLYPETSNWWYEHINEYGKDETTPSFGVGLQYDVGRIYSSPVGMAIEVNEIQLQITKEGNPESYRGAAEARGYVVPVELWGYVSSSGRFGPFIRVGVGAVKTKLTETFTKAAYTDNVYESWSFCYACGAGLRYSVSERFDLMAYLEGFVATEKINTVNRYGDALTVEDGRGYPLYGFRVAYRF